MALFGLFSLAICVVLADLAGNDDTRPFTRFVFVVGALVETGLSLTSIVHWTGQVVGTLI